MYTDFLDHLDLLLSIPMYSGSRVGQHAKPLFLFRYTQLDDYSVRVCLLISVRRYRQVHVAVNSVCFIPSTGIDGRDSNICLFSFAHICIFRFYYAFVYKRV